MCASAAVDVPATAVNIQRTPVCVRHNFIVKFLEEGIFSNDIKGGEVEKLLRAAIQVRGRSLRGKSG